MTVVILILTILNSAMLIFFTLKWFNETYTIVSKEAYDEIANYYLQYHDEEGNELNHELAGGVGTPYYGFFQDYLDDPGEEEEEENE